MWLSNRKTSAPSLETGSEHLKYYAPICLDPSNATSEEREKAAEVFREYGCWIKSKTLTIRHYELISRMPGKPSMDDLKKVSGELIGLSNFIRGGKTPASELDTTRRERISKYLHLR